jgi:hypothetical protein
MTAEVINAAWAEGQGVKDDLAAKITAVSSAILTAPVIAGTDVVAVTVPTVTAPGVTIPSSVAVGDIYADFETKYIEIGTWLADKFTAFKTSYFPSNETTYSAVESWVQGALANPNAGIPLAVQSQIIEDDRARILADTARAKENLFASFAARRFPMPPGAAASAAMQLDQKAQDLMAESSRKVAIASIEQMKFAVDKAIALRSVAMSSCLDYIKVMASGQSESSKLVGVGYDAQSKLISAASQFYSADTNAKEMIAKVSEFNSQLKLEGAAKNQAAELTNMELKIKALLSEVQALSTMTTSLFNNIHASTSVSG